MVTMKKTEILTAYGFVLLLLLSLYACGAKQEPAAKMDFAKGAVTVRYQADKQLNLVDGRPHSLLVVLYQLSDPNVFNSYSGSREGLVKLLDGNSFDKTVVAVHKEYIEPGGSGTITLDRAEHAEHVAVVAGFNNLAPAKCTLFLDIHTETSRHGILLTKKTSVLPVDIKLILAKDGLRQEKADNES